MLLFWCTLTQKVSYTALLLNFYIRIVALFLLTNSKVYQCVVVNWSTFTIINLPCIYFYKQAITCTFIWKIASQYWLKRVTCLLGLMINFVCGIQPLQQKLFVKAAVSQFVPFSLSSITLHKLICATTLPFSVSWTPYFDLNLD